MRLKLWFITIITVCATILLANGASATLAFLDNFNRANSATVGNGWLEGEDGSSGLAIDTNNLYGSARGQINRTDYALDDLYCYQVVANSSTWSEFYIGKGANRLMTRINAGTAEYYVAAWNSCGSIPDGNYFCINGSSNVIYRGDATAHTMTTLCTASTQASASPSGKVKFDINTAFRIDNFCIGDSAVDCGILNAPGVNGSLDFISPTENSGLKFYINTHPYIQVSTNESGIVNYTNTTIYLYNTTGLYTSYTGSSNITSTNFTGLPTGNYTLNATAYNKTGQVANTTARNYIVYNFTLNLTSPSLNENVTGAMNISYSTTLSPTGGITITGYNLTLLNSDGTFNRSIVNTSSLTNYSWDYVATGLMIGSYKINLTYNDANGVTSTITGSLFNVITDGSLNVTARAYSTNATITNFSVYIGGILYNTTSGSLAAPFTKGAINNLTITASGYLNQSTSYNGNSSYSNLSFTLYRYNSLYITFYDEITGLLLNQTPVYLELISDIYSENYTSTNGTLVADLLTPTDYVSRYEATGYTERFYYFTISDDTYQVLNLYLLNSSLYSNITITVYDQTTLPLENAVVSALKFDITTNSYLTVEICTTNFEGECQMDLTMFDEFYKFIVVYNGETIKVTSPTYITSNSIIIQVVTGGEILRNFIDYESVDFIMNWYDATNQSKLFYNDVSNLATNYCLKVYRIGVLNGDTMLSSNCSTATTNNLYVGVTRVYGYQYEGRFYYTEDGTEKLIGKLNIPEVGIALSEDQKNNLLGLQIIILFIIAILAVVLNLGGILPALIPVALFLGRVVGLNNFNINGLLGLVMLGVMLSFWLNGRRNG